MNKKTLVIVVISLAASVFVYARFIEPRWVAVKKIELEIIGKKGDEKSNEPIRVLHLSDLHVSPEVPLSFLNDALRTAVEQNPDLICVTGDYITHYLENVSQYSETLRILTRAAPTIACPGNHDGGLWARERGGYPTVDEVKAMLENAGMIFLENQVKEIEIRGTTVLVAGVGDIWAARCFPTRIAQVFDTSTADLKVILTHNPDSKSELVGLNWDLLLAGHTHGGQFKLPLIGTPLAPVRDRRFVSGLYDFNKRKIHVSPGIGNLHGLRFNSRPEISVLEIR